MRTEENVRHLLAEDAARIDKLQSQLQAAQAERDEACDLLRRLSEWDHMQTAADGPFWLREIEAALRASTPSEGDE